MKPLRYLAEYYAKRYWFDLKEAPDQIPPELLEAKRLWEQSRSARSPKTRRAKISKCQQLVEASLVLDCDWGCVRELGGPEDRRVKPRVLKIATPKVDFSNPKVLIARISAALVIGLRRRPEEFDTEFMEEWCSEMEFMFDLQVRTPDPDALLGIGGEDLYFRLIEPYRERHA